MVAGVSRTPGRISRANARVGGNASLSEASARVGVHERRREQPDRALQVRRLARERAHRRVEVRDQVLEQALVADQRAARARRALEQARDVALRLGAEQRLVDAGAAAQRHGRVLVGVVERLGRGLAAGRGVGVAIVGRARLRVEPLREPVEQVAQVLARVALQRGEDLVELHRRRGAGDLDRVAGLELRRRRRAGLEVDEEVALEEDARADLGGRVLVDRQPGVVDLHDHERLVGALPGLDRLDLAHVDAGDPHRRVDAQPVGRLEDGVDPEALGERDVLGEAEEERDGGDRERDQPDREGAALLAAAAGDGGGHYLVPSVTAGCRPGTLPITWRPVRNGSLPDSHSFGCPGDAVFGYGLEWR